MPISPLDRIAGMREIGIGLGFFLLIGGCASYDYSIRTAGGESKHLRTNGDEELADGPILWRARVVEGRAVVRVYNTTGGSIAIKTSGSATIDPSGQRHPVTPATLPPGAFARFILPPPPPVYQPRGGLHAGIYYGNGGDEPFPFDPAQPPGYSARDENDPTRWDWRGDGEAGILLNIASETNAAPHQLFVIRAKR